MANGNLLPPPSLRLGMKGVKEDQQIDGIAGFSVKGDIYFFMFFGHHKCGGLWMFFPKMVCLSFHTCTFTVNHGLFQDKKFMEYKPRSSNIAIFGGFQKSNLRGRRACT